MASWPVTATATDILTSSLPTEPVASSPVSVRLESLVIVKEPVAPVAETPDGTINASPVIEKLDPNSAVALTPEAVSYTHLTLPTTMLV